MSKADRRNGVPATVTSIPLVDPHAVTEDASIGHLVKEASAQVSTLVRAEVELARAEITRDLKKGVTGSGLFIAAAVLLLYSTFFAAFTVAELLDTWFWRWAAFGFVFLGMVFVAVGLAFIGYLKVRKIRGPRDTIETVKESAALFSGGGHATESNRLPEKTTDPSGW